MSIDFLLTSKIVKVLNLHLRTTLLVSAITLCVLLALLFVISARLADVARRDEMTLTEVTSVNLADHFSRTAARPEPRDIDQAITLVSSSRLYAVNVRLWELNGETFEVRRTDADQTESAPLPAEIRDRLLGRYGTKPAPFKDLNPETSTYRVISPIVNRGRVIGAVEISNRLETLPSVLQQTVGTAVILALIAVALIALATWILFRDLVYQPISHLLAVMDRAGKGELRIRAPERGDDELSRLARAFNRMMGQLHEMTVDREKQREMLRDRIEEATAQLEVRNDQLAKANQELWQTTRRLTQFERLAAAGQTASQFAHEVGTPLNLISCHAQLIEAESGSADDRERAAIIVEQTDRIERIVRRMLDRTRTEAPEMHPLDLNSIIERIRVSTAPTLTEPGVRLVTELEPNLPLIAGDSDKLQQVFINLINNALDAMPDGGDLRIETRFRRGSHGSGDEVLVTVSDTGCGMTPEVLAHVFDPLYTTKERGRGTGLGLVVVSQIIQEHGGTLRAESSSGSGSTFHLTFPTLTGKQTDLDVKPDGTELPLSAVENKP